ncbi:hypothetical protein KFL_006050020 [Klebsormidium nitens]|uniref:Uncharacterized protein n=1 Tax=Klebsormidium nitens TaxID=105231 RepID=A0A1Y1IL26_KLENI|nr:hypothetical protein KFL_006050020 [Klebsormidium nitens]|eukprot:GAQ90139.1 hypothetical protein KFL_006050020 [Klebsormidium nitens]
MVPGAHSRIKRKVLNAVKAPEESETERELPVLPVLQKVMQDNEWPREDIFDCTDGFSLSSTGVSRSGLFQAIETAYSGHHNLHLRPDDIMLAIAQGVSAHLSYKDNAEKYRKVFVDHDGKETIKVDATQSLTGDSRLLKWPRCVQLIVDQLNERVKGDTCQLLVNDFSTTDDISKTASQVVLMDTMKHYFEYILDITCGIPAVKLQGSLEDWHRLLAKARALRALEIGLDRWLDDLEPVLEKLIDTYSGNVDQDWWSRVLTGRESYGSGGPRRYYDGWFSAFFPYTAEGDPTDFERGMAAGKYQAGWLFVRFRS